jgi:hypothetical protein
VSARREHDVLSRIARERHGCERHRRAAAHVEHGAARQAQRLAHGERLGRASEIGRIRHPQHDGTEERSVRGVDHRAVARRTPVARDESEVAAQRLERPAGDARAGIDGERIRVPRLACLPDGEHDALAAGRADDEPHRRAAQQVCRRGVDHGSCEQRAAPRVDGTQHGAQAVAEQRRRGREHQRRGERGPGGEHRPPVPLAAKRRSEHALARQRPPRSRGRARRERAPAFQLERSEERAASQSLLGLDRVRDLSAGRTATKPFARPPRERHRRRDHYEPHHERHDPWKGKPACIAEHSRADGDDQRSGARTEQPARDHLAAPDLPALPLDELVKCHETGRLVTA